jgi:hypothetical protein
MNKAIEDLQNVISMAMENYDKTGKLGVGPDYKL